MTLFFKHTSTIIGKLKLVSTNDALVALLWEYEKPGRVKLDPMVEDQKHPLLLRAEKELSEYFSGARKTFNISFKLEGTDFQKNVWKALYEIPFGRTVSYSDIACAIGHPSAVRAVGSAIGRNPISIIIPCHRVIGKNGCMAGFAGKIHVKETLLELEGAECALRIPKRSQRSGRLF